MQYAINTNLQLLIARTNLNLSYEPYAPNDEPGKLNSTGIRFSYQFV
ncbi:hypothetical protein [Spirosoma pulveris]